MKKESFVPIGIKLVAIITGIVVVAVSLVLTLFYFSVRADVARTAEANNKTVNQMNTSLAENFFTSVFNDVAVLLHAETGVQNSVSIDNLPNIAAIVIGQEIIINNAFFEAHALDASTLTRFMQNAPAQTTLRQTGIVNAYPSFHIALAALFDAEHDAVIIVSTEGLTEDLGSGANLSYLAGDDGAILVHPDNDIIENSAMRNTLETEQEDAPYIKDLQHLSSVRAEVITYIADEVVYEGLIATMRRSVYLALTSLFLGLAAVWCFSFTISRPIERLTSAVNQIEDGHYDIALSSGSGHDEIGLLSGNVISMSHVFGNFEKLTNKVIARLARKGELSVGGKSKEATVFFSDIRGFTAISEKMKSHEVIEFLNDYMDRMVRCVFLTGGTIDKFIGDAIMAHWGALDSPENVSPAQNAFSGIMAALMMRAALASFNIGRGGVKKPIIQIGCALNSGMLVAGQIGSNERLEFTVIGNTVTLADHTEPFNKPFGTEILITEHTYNLAGKFFITEEMPAITEAKEKVRIFAVVNVRGGKLSEWILGTLASIPKTNPDISRKYVGAGGPQTLTELRKLMNIPEPDLSKVKTDEEEKKYQLSN